MGPSFCEQARYDKLVIGGVGQVVATFNEVSLRLVYYSVSRGACSRSNSDYHPRMHTRAHRELQSRGPPIPRRRTESKHLLCKQEIALLESPCTSKAS